MFGSSFLRHLPLACLCLIAAPGCSKKAAKTRVGADALAKVPPVKPEPLPIPKTNPHVDQLGHLVVDDLLGLLGRLEKVSSEPEKFQMPDLRAMLQKQFPGSNIPARIMLNQPMGCVVYDPIQYMGESNWPGVCFFSYQGGAGAFVKDIETQVEALAPEGHGFHTLIQDRHVYVDELDGSVVVSGEASRFAASVDYLKSNIFARKSSISGVSMDLYVADMYQRYEPLIQNLMKSVLEKKGTSLALFDQDPETSQAATKKMLEILRESEQIRIGFHCDEHRYTLSYSQRVKEHAPAFKQAVAQGYDSSISTDLIARMPNELVMLAASSIAPAKAESNSQATVTRWRSLAKATGRDEAWAQKMLGYERNMYKYLGDQAAMAMFPQSKGPGSLIAMVQAAQGISLQEKWRAELSTWSGKTWGEAFDRYFAMRFTPSAKKVDGVMLDEFKITAKEPALKELSSSMGPEDFTSFMNWLGSLSLVIHLGQVEHIAFAVATTHDADNSSSMAVAALRGVDNFVLDPEFSSVAQKFTGNSIAAVVDSGALSRFLKSAQPGPQDKPHEVRNGLQDSQFITRVDPEQGSAMIWSVSSPLVPLFHRAAKRGSKLGTLAR